MTYEVLIDGKPYRLELQRAGKNSERWQCRLNGRELPVDAVLARADVISILIEGKAFEVKRERIGSDLHLWVGSERYAAVLRDPRSFRSRRQAADAEGGPKQLVAPMPGKVVRVLVNEHDAVEAGQGVVVVEAMKMQNEIKSPKQGTIQKLAVTQGAAVNAGDVLAIVE
ncbi:MAG TPA: biotin/lipoyl-containing protein [Terriglobales bacterium]|nr:biotin/lipoyl-containing protein [Terriglobales bacterium]